ncbi:MAG: GNAT family N-acetyltransferase [Eubacteriales bacterium]|nr:GNAT family N-acetyltransferase [Eubacteriales bacterium]
MNNIQRLLSQKPLERITQSEMLRKGLLGTVFEGEESALMYAEHMDLYVLMANNEAAAEEAISHAQNPKLILSDISSFDKEIIRRFSLNGSTVCFSAAYLSQDKILVSPDIVLRPLSLEHLDRVDKDYPIYSREKIRRCILSGVLQGGFHMGEWVGFIGQHEEGTMGMLHIFDEYRKRGFGYELEARLINKLLDLGDIPTGHVVTNNHASLALQRKLGMHISEGTISWIY